MAESKKNQQPREQQQPRDCHEILHFDLAAKEAEIRRRLRTLPDASNIEGPFPPDAAESTAGGPSTQLYRRDDAFKQEFAKIVQETTQGNPFGVTTFASSSSPNSFRYPDHEFAINESRITINWALANCLIMCHSDLEMSFQRAWVAESNIHGKIPRFVDSTLVDWDAVYESHPKRRKKQKIEEDAVERERKWCSIGYYKIYPPNDQYEGGNWNDLFGRSLQFSRDSVKRFLDAVKADLKEVNWESLTPVSEPIYTDEDKSGRLATTVHSFLSNLGDRVEFWDYQDDADCAYAILQTHRGRAVVVSVLGCHAHVVCNLLEFFNSHGNTDMPNLLTSQQDSSIDKAVVLVGNILQTAMDFLYGPYSMKDSASP